MGLAAADMKRAGEDDVYGKPAGEDLPLFAAVDLFADSVMEPTELERLVGGLIAQHRGRKNAIALRSLMDVTGKDERHVRGVVEQLIVSHRWRIGAALQAPSGYYMIETAEDLEMAVGTYRSQIFTMLRRLRVLMAPHQVRELLGQMTAEDAPGE